MSITSVGNSSLSNQVSFKSSFASQKPPVPPQISDFFKYNNSENKKSNTAKYAAGAISLAALVVAGIALKGKFGKVLNSLGNKAPEAIQGTKPAVETAVNETLNGTKGVVQDVAERTLSNGKKVIKTVTENPGGTKTVEMKLFNPDGSHAYTKTKNITKTVGENGTVISRIDKYSGNGKETVIQLGKDKDSYGYDVIHKYPLTFTKSGEREIVRTYDKNNKLIGRDTRRVMIGNEPLDNTVKFERLTFNPETGELSSKSQYERCLSHDSALVTRYDFKCKKGFAPRISYQGNDLTGVPDEICDKLRINTGKVMYDVIKKPVRTYDLENNKCIITDGAKS